MHFTTREGTAGTLRRALAYLVALGVVGTALALAYDWHWRSTATRAMSDARPDQPGSGGAGCPSGPGDGPVRPDHRRTQHRYRAAGLLAALRRELQHGPAGRPLYGQMGHDVLR